LRYGQESSSRQSGWPFWVWPFCGRLASSSWPCSALSGAFHAPAVAAPVEMPTSLSIITKIRNNPCPLAANRAHAKAICAWGAKSCMRPPPWPVQSPTTAITARDEDILPDIDAEVQFGETVWTKSMASFRVSQILYR
jgi:hypothetical protein